MGESGKIKPTFQTLKREIEEENEGNSSITFDYGALTKLLDDNQVIIYKE